MSRMHACIDDNSWRPLIQIPIHSLWINLLQNTLSYIHFTTLHSAISFIKSKRPQGNPTKPSHHHIKRLLTSRNNSHTVISYNSTNFKRNHETSQVEKLYNIPNTASSHVSWRHPHPPRDAQFDARVQVAFLSALRKFFQLKYIVAHDSSFKEGRRLLRLMSDSTRCID